jgi:hypothetical protein
MGKEFGATSVAKKLKTLGVKDQTTIITEEACQAEAAVEVEVEGHTPLDPHSICSTTVK